jgi:hypothetical protein
MFKVESDDILVTHVTITAKRNGKGKLKAFWDIELSNGGTEKWSKVYKNMAELRKEMAEQKAYCLAHGMKPEEMTMQNFYN